MLRKKIAAVLAAVMLVSSTGIFAADVGPGLGKLIIPEDKQGIGWDLLKSWLNGLWWNQWGAIISGTSGYEKGGVAMVETNQFIADNMDALAIDIAQGSGEYVDTLSAMLNVSDSVAFKATLQSNFDSIFSSENVSAEKVSAKIYSFL